MDEKRAPSAFEGAPCSNPTQNPAFTAAVFRPSSASLEASLPTSARRAPGAVAVPAWRAAFPEQCAAGVVHVRSAEELASAEQVRSGSVPSGYLIPVDESVGLWPGCSIPADCSAGLRARGSIRDGPAEL
jgi:hypothetical protein